MDRFQPAFLAVVMVIALAHGLLAQEAAPDCSPYTLNGLVRECTSAGSPGQQLRAGTFIAGSAATGETVAQALALEVATAPAASSSAGLTYTFDLSTRTFARRAGTFGPAFSERAVTIGRGKLSGGVSFLHRSYDKLEALDLERFDVFRFREGTLPITSSRLELIAKTETLAGFATYGLAEHVEIGVVVPYVRISVKGTARIFDQRDEELQRVFLNAASDGVGDIGIVSKWHFWSSKPDSDQSNRQVALAAAAGVRLPTGDSEGLLGLGLTRTTLSFIGSANAGRLSAHVNAGYEFWSDGIEVPKDFLGQTSIRAKDQVLYSAGFEWEAHPQLSAMFDVLGSYLRGAGGVGYQPFTFPPNFANVAGAEALIAVPNGVHRVILVPGAKWNAFRSLLLTMNALVTVTSGGLRSNLTPVVGAEWGF
jgi:hypothetical protein